MYQTPTPIPSRPGKAPSRRKRRSDRGQRVSPPGVVLAAGLTIAVGAGLIVAGGSGRPIEVLVLAGVAAVGFLLGWPVSGHAAVGGAAAYLILETVYGRLDGAHLAGELLLTAGMLGAVLAAGFARPDRPMAPRRRAAAPAREDAGAVDPWADERPDARRLRPGTLEYEIERARRSERPLSVLAIRADELDFLAASETLPQLLGLIGAAVERTVRAMDIVTRPAQTRFEVLLPETDAESARTVAERIRLRIDSTRPEPAPGRPAGVTVSIGVATYPADGADEIELGAAAGRALERASELGGNRTVLYSLPAGAPPGWALTGR